MVVEGKVVGAGTNHTIPLEFYCTRNDVRTRESKTNYTVLSGLRLYFYKYVSYHGRTMTVGPTR